MVRVRRRKKRNRPNVNWRVVTVRVGSIQYRSIKIFCPLGTYLVLWDICIATYQVFMYIFMSNWFKYFDQKNQTIFIRKCFNTHRAKYVPRGQNVSIPPYCILLVAVTLVAVALICSCLMGKSAGTLSWESWKYSNNYLHNVSLSAVTLVTVAVICSCLTGKSARKLIWKSLKYWVNYFKLKWLLSVLLWLEILQGHCLRKFEVVNRCFHDTSIIAVTLVAVAVIGSAISLMEKSPRTLNWEGLKYWINYLHNILIIVVTIVVAVAVVCFFLTEKSVTALSWESLKC